MGAFGNRAFSSHIGSLVAGPAAKTRYTVVARWFLCYTPQLCYQNEYKAIFTPQDGGYDVFIDYGNIARSTFETPTFDVGYQTYSPDFPGGSNDVYTSLTDIPRSVQFFIPAAFRGLNSAPGAVTQPWAHKPKKSAFVLPAIIRLPAPMNRSRET